MEEAIAGPGIPRSVKLVRFIIDACWYICWVAVGSYIPMLITGYFVTGEFVGAAEIGWDQEAGFTMNWEKFNWISNQILFSSLFILYCLYQLRRIAHAVVAGNPFVSEMPGRIRLLAYGIIAWEPFENITRLFLTRMDMLLRTDAGVASSKFSFSGEPLLYGLLVLALAHVFARGVELQDERDLRV